MLGFFMWAPEGGYCTDIVDVGGCYPGEIALKRALASGEFSPPRSIVEKTSFSSPLYPRCAVSCTLFNARTRPRR